MDNEKCGVFFFFQQMMCVLLECWFGQSLGSIGRYITCATNEMILSGRYHPRQKSRTNQNPEVLLGQSRHSKPAQQSLGVL